MNVCVGHCYVPAFAAVAIVNDSLRRFFEERLETVEGRA